MGTSILDLSKGKGGNESTPFSGSYLEKVISIFSDSAV